MRYLVVETVAAVPHLETAGEIAIKLASEENQVFFCFLGHSLPWSDWDLPWIFRLLGGSYKERVERFQELLAQKGISIVSPPALSSAHRESLRLWAKSFSGNLEDLKGFQYQNARLGMGVASSLISFFRSGQFSPEENQSLVRRALVSSGVVFSQGRELIGELKPETIVTFNGRFATTKPIVLASEQEHIPVLIHERGSRFDKYEMFSGPVHNFEFRRREIERYWNSAEATQREKLGNEFFVKRRNGDGIGWYSFTDYQTQGRVPAKKDGYRRFVYFSSSDDEFAAISDGFSTGPWPNQLRAVRDLVTSVEQIPNCELVIRVHPHLKVKSKRERVLWEAIQGQNIINLSPYDKTDSYALIDSADVVISYGSTIGMEAAYWGKPTILLGSASYSESGAVIRPSSKEELQLLLTQSEQLEKPQRALCLPYGFYYLTFGCEYEVYKPLSLSEGTFLGENLDWKPNYLRALKKAGLNHWFKHVAQFLNQRG